MNTNIKTAGMKDTKVLLSTLWIFVMFNMLKVDILSLYIPGALEEMAEFAGGTPIPQLMLGGAILMEIPIAMIVLSQVLKYRVNRWANIIAGAITIVFVVGGGSRPLSLKSCCGAATCSTVSSTCKAGIQRSPGRSPSSSAPSSLAWATCSKHRPG